MVKGRGLRPSTLVTVAVAVAVVSWVVWTLWTRAGRLLLPVSWSAPLLLLAIGVLVLAAAVPVRRFLRGEATRSLDPIRAARTLALGQAAALTGAVAAGWYAGELPVLLADLRLQTYRELRWPVVAALLAAAALAVAGMVAQRWCRVSPPEDKDEDEG